MLHVKQFMPRVPKVVGGSLLMTHPLHVPCMACSCVALPLSAVWVRSSPSVAIGGADKSLSGGHGARKVEVAYHRAYRLVSVGCERIASYTSQSIKCTA